MKWKIYLFFLANFIFLSCNKDKDNEVISTKFIHKYGFELSENEWIDRKEEGKIITKLKNNITKTTSYKKGAIDGPSIITYPNSDIIHKIFDYKEGILKKVTVYNMDQTPIAETLFKDLDTKIITFWNKQGIPLRIETYKKDILWEGKYFNPQNEIESTITEGSGLRIKKDENNNIVLKEELEKGQIISRTTLHPNGNIKSKSFFSENILNGMQETFSPTGILITQIPWSKGKIDGLQKCYRNNVKYSEIPYIDGKKEGIEKEYDINGNLVKEIHWNNDLRHGSSRYYHPDYTDIQWYWKGIAVDLKKFQTLEFREKLMSELKEQNSTIKDIEKKAVR